MFKVNVFEVKAKLSEYLDRVLRGERIVICRHNKPVAELRAIEGVRSEPRPVGPLRGRPVFDIPPGFFEPLPDDELDRWEGLDGDPPAAAGPSRPGAGASRVAERKDRHGARPRRSAPKRRS